MSKIKLKVKKAADGTVGLYKNKKLVTSVEIKKDVHMEIDVGSGFNEGAFVSVFSLFENVRKRKGKSLGDWKRSNPSVQPSTEINVAITSPTAILVTDVNTKEEDGDFFFGVTVMDGQQPYETDPELKVKKIAK